MNTTSVKFPGMINITVREGMVMIKIMKQDGCTAKEVMSFLKGIDDSLTLLKTASVINRFRGKRNIGKSAADLIYERLMQIEI